MVFSICNCKFMVLGFHHYARSLNFFNKYDEKGNLLVTEKYLEDNLMQRTEYDNKGNTIKYVQYDLYGVIINYWEAE